MKNYDITTVQKAALLEHIYAFIDSKLQFLNYEIDAAVRTFEVNDSIPFSSTDTSFSPHASNRFEKVLAHIEIHSKTKGKLLLIRSRVANHNAQLAFYLLTDNKYTVYTEKILTNMLDQVTTAEDSNL
jgi:hypothetical protein